MLNAVAHQSSMQELDLLNPQLDPRISYTGGPKWYFGSNGLMQESVGNYLLYGNDFTNGFWVPAFGSISANAALVLGGVRMAKLVENTSDSQHRISQTYAAKAGAWTAQVKVKAAERSNLLLRIFEGPSTIRAASYFDLATGTVESTIQGTASIRSLGEGVYLCTVTGTLTADANLTVYINTAKPGAVGSYLGDGTSGLLIAQAMLHKGSTATRYIDTTSAIAYDWPLEYDPITLQPLGRSGWEQRTNQVTRSQESSASSFGITQADNASVAPDGTTTMVQQTNNGASGQHFKQAVSAWPATAAKNTYSIYIKKGAANFVHILVSSLVAYAQFDLTTGALVYSSAGSMTGFTASLIETLPGGILRFAISGTNTTGSASNIRVYFLDAAQNSSGPSEVSTSNGYWWGEQSEIGTCAGPYIPTFGSQVTRVQDNASVDANIAQRLRFPGQAGTVLLEVRYPLSTEKYTFMQIDDGDSGLDDDWLFYTNNNFDQLVCRLYPGGAHTGVHLVTPNTNLRMVEAADAAGAITSVNGDTPTIGANGCSQAGMQRVRLGASSSSSGAAGGFIRRATFYPGKFTAAEVQARAA